MENPNPTPSFIRAGGILGNPVKLTNQVCTRVLPASTPVVIYDNSATYASGNGAIVESVTVVATDVVAKSTLFIFIKLDNIGSDWLLWHEIDLPALSAITATTKPTDYPLRGTLKRAYGFSPNVGTIPFSDALRLNGESRVLQVGVALGVTVGTNPIIVYLEGGEY